MPSSITSLMLIQFSISNYHFIPILITAANEICRSYMSAEDIGDNSDCFIPNIMSVSVIDAFEIIRINVQYGKNGWISASFGSSQLRDYLSDESTVCVETCQLVCQRIRVFQQVQIIQYSTNMRDEASYGNSVLIPKEAISLVV